MINNLNFVIFCLFITFSVLFILSMQDDYIWNANEGDVLCKSVQWILKKIFSFLYVNRWLSFLLFFHT